MIQSALSFLAMEAFIVAGVAFLYKKFPNKVFNWLPQIVVVLVLNILFNTFGVWDTTAISATKSSVMNFMTPCMVFLITIKCNVKRMIKIGPKMVAVFFLTTLSLFIGFIVSFMLVSGNLGMDQLPETFGTWMASFCGGVENLYAVAGGTGLSDGNLANVLILINLVYSPWVMILILMVPFAAKFNKWTRADLTEIDKVANNLSDDDAVGTLNQYDLFLLITIGLITLAVADVLKTPLYSLIPFVPEQVWMYIVVTVVAAVLGTCTKLGKIAGGTELGGMMAVYVIGLSVATINLKDFTNVGYFMLSGVIILVVHAVLMILVAKLMKVDLMTLGCASIANIGGISSAPVVAAAYTRSHQSIAVIMAALGSIAGTIVGLGLTALLRFIS